MTDLVPANQQRREITATERYMTARFLDQWGTPNCVSFKAYVGEYIRALDGTDPAILKAAGDYLIDNHAYPMRWPLVAECKAVVRDIAEERAQRKALMIAPPEEVPPTTEQRKRAATLMQQVAANLKASGDAMVARTSVVSKAASFAEEKPAESGVKLPAGWRDTSRNAFEGRAGKLYQEAPAPKLSEVGRPPNREEESHEYP